MQDSLEKTSRRASEVPAARSAQLAEAVDRWEAEGGALAAPSQRAAGAPALHRGAGR